MRGIWIHTLGGSLLYFKPDTMVVRLVDDCDDEVVEKLDEDDAPNTDDDRYFVNVYPIDADSGSIVVVYCGSLAKCRLAVRTLASALLDSTRSLFNAGED